MKIPQIEPFIGQEEYLALKPSFDAKWLTEGPKTKEFEEKLLELIGAKYGVFAPNGTLALFVALMAIGVGSGDEVIVPNFTFMGSATAVSMTGATPVFVDVNRNNFQIDVSHADKIINKHTKAIMPVHVYGTMCNMQPIISFAKKHNLLIVEDAAQAIGVKYMGKHAGTFGDIGCFSFFADKTITTGEGGFVVTNNKETYENLLYIRNQGRLHSGTFIHPRIGFNLRTTDLHSSIGLVQMKKLPKIIERKEEILKVYIKHLSPLSELNIFTPEPNYPWIPFRVGVLAENAFDLMKYMEEKGIASRGFFYPLHKQPAFSHLGPYSDEDFPNSIYGYEHGVCLPTYPTLKDEQIKYICDTIKDFYLGKRDLFYKYYDQIYKEKDYARETDYIFKTANDSGLGYEKVLEIGCGTGNHTKEILKDKTIKKMVTLDVDSRMIEKTTDKLSTDKRLTIREGRVEMLEETGFDLALAMFNVASYIPDLTQIDSFFAASYKALKPGGLLIFDTWNGIAAIKDPPREEKETIALRGGKELVKQLTPELDLLNQHVALKYNLSLEKEGEVEENSSFIMDQYLWTPMQLRSSYNRTGFEELGVYSLKDFEKKATEADWKIIYVLRKPS